ncbi:MAG: GntR family transcriptional regulator [Actinomycetales bacterium]|nr:GntR family transcriptional regulator [Actinomycetales bacterium]
MTQPGLDGDFGGELLSTTVKRLLLDRILGGEYAPGERIVELRLAKELGLSQSPVREALRDLAAGLHIVTIHPRRGARVRLPTAKELADVSVVRSEIDALAARLAVETLSEDTLSELAGLLAEMKASAETGDFRSLASSDAKFHALIAESSANSAVTRVFDQLEPFARTFITFSLPNVDVSSILREHADIMSALEARDGERASRAARDHQLNVSRLIRESQPWA